MPDSPASWHPPDLAAKFLQNVRGSIPLTIEQIDMMLRIIDAARGAKKESLEDIFKDLNKKWAAAKAQAA